MAALYQRARPATFAGLVGQEHVKDVLARAVAGGKTTHAYLFSGPRGVGKTTTARLLAMAVNCESDGERPCGKCESCRLVQSVSHPDVIELDAASNNSVDDVRDLQERVGLASMRGGMRVWILDEAHMLSKAAANALLKTLEEPPAGLMFVLATTEPEKLPPTILSRCQHFRFRRLSDAEIEGKLQGLCQAAGVEVEASALALIARSADGGMRDAESLLERLLVSGERIELAAAERALGLPPHERMARIGAALVAGDLATLLAEAGALYRDGFAPRTVAEQLARALRDELHAVLEGSPRWAGTEHEPLLRLLHALDDESDRFVRQNDLYGLEVALIKTRNALWRPARDADLERRAPAPARLEARLEARPAASPPQPPTQASDAPPAASQPASAPAASEEPQTPSDDAPPAKPQGSLSWHAVRSAAGPQLKAFLHPAQVEIDGAQVRLSYDDKHAFHHAQLTAKLDELSQLVASVGGPGYQVTVSGPAKTGRSRSATRATLTPEPRAASASDPAPAPTPTPAAAGDLASELELAGFSEDDDGWPEVAPGEAPDAPTAAGRPASGQAGVTSSAELSAQLSDVQQLFPGRVVEVVPDALVSVAVEPATLEVGIPADDDSASVGDEPGDDDSYDDGSQERLAFGPGRPAGEA